MGEYIVAENRTHREYLQSMRRLRLEYVAKGYIRDRWTAKHWREWHRQHHGRSQPPSSLGGSAGRGSLGGGSPPAAEAGQRRFVTPVQAAEAMQSRWARARAFRRARTTPTTADDYDDFAWAAEAESPSSPHESDDEGEDDELSAEEGDEHMFYI